MANFFKLLRRNKKVSFGLFIVTTYLLIALSAPFITSHDPNDRVARPHQEPSVENVFGTTRMGRDVYHLFVHGTATSLAVGFGAGLIIVVIGTALGVSAGYFGGKYDEFVSLITNIALVIPQLPLLLVLAAFIGEASPLTIAIIIGLTSWAWGARVTRSQTLTLRNKEFIHASELACEPPWRIIFVEILPNLSSIIGLNFLGSIIYTIITEATLEFLGLGDPLAVSWGTMLFNAQNASAMTVGAWWEVLVPCLAIAILGMGLALLNFGIDEIANPRLRTFSGIKRFNKRIKQLRAKQAASSVVQSSSNSKEVAYHG
ncbi:ABC transporter permease [Motilimonas eburnea]|uniref:ABC transporter permease n=1 Tax=Motilimonas eburnea TaxID=1737488 RepID=UPI001E45EBEE|nr:ABC transporter permease [Motilimonas eburnea]MCE2572001.1 ABC transporter permease [Motilimonas eburnea]